MSERGTPTRLQIVHRTGYRYQGMVAASYNEARMTPMVTEQQSLLSARVVVEPVTWTFPYRDYWGTQVTAFDVMQAHDRLDVTSSSTVEILSCDLPAPDGDWSLLQPGAQLDGHSEFLPQTASTEPPAEVVELARAATAGLRPDAAARAICARLHEALEYRPGATAVTTPAADVWAQRSGVCQDFAHLALGALRSVGVPARYVSGYVHHEPQAAIGQTVQGESHAWIEWWAGRWVAFDPTSLRPVGPLHVVVARGRDYRDVTPLKGIYAGPADSQLFVQVEITRLS